MSPAPRPAAQFRTSASPHSSSRRNAASFRALAGAPIPKIGYFGWKTWDLAFDACACRRTVVGEGQGVLRPRPTGSKRRAPIRRRARSVSRGGLEEAIRMPRSASVRPSHRPFPGHPLQDRADGREMEAARQLCIPCAARSMRAACDRKPRWRSYSPGKWPSGSRARRCRSTAAPATRSITPSSGTGAMRA